MRTLLVLAVTVAIAVGGPGTVLGGCKAGWDDVPASAVKPTKDYPCGVVGVPCMDSVGKLNGECCWEGETCGGGYGSVGCPAGECCDVRSFTPDVMGAKRGDGGAGTGNEADAGIMVVRHAQTVAPRP